MFNLARNEELSCPGAAQPEQVQSEICSSWSFSLQLHVACGSGLPCTAIQMKMKLSEVKIFLKCVQMGSETRELSHQAHLHQEQLKLAIASFKLTI